MVQYINEARELGLEVSPPDVNESGFKFTVTGDRRIRFGLGAVRNVGRGAIESIIQGRSASAYVTLNDLARRIDLRLCNKRVLDSLIAAGALDGLNGHRAQLVQGTEEALREAQLLAQELEAGQNSLFGEEATPTRASGAALVDVPAWSEQERLTKEKEVIGFFISGHPLERFRAETEVFGTRTTATLGEWSEHPVTIAAVITQVKRQISKKTGKEYARIILEDFHGTAEAIIFPDAWARLNMIVRDDLSVLLSGGYSRRDQGEERAPFVVEGARPLEDLKAAGALGVALRWKLGEAPALDILEQVVALLGAHPGPAPLYIEWSDGNGERLRARARRLRISPDEALVQNLRRLLGPEAVAFVKAG